jgi:GNAT superfamily N-acetyltransferase
VADDVRVSERVRVEPDRLVSETGRTLIAELMDDLEARYGAPDPEAPPAHELAPPDGIFFVAWRGDDALGCGGLRRYARHTGEIKRMYVRPAARRAGVARTLLAALEERARSIGYRRLILETGVRQPEAIALYRAAGYDEIDRYGPYADLDLSRCFAKGL